MRKIYVSAYCSCNVGDDMFIRTLVNRYPQTKFHLFADRKYCQAFSNEDNLNVTSGVGHFLYKCLHKFGVVNRRTIHVYYAKRTDATVKIGGSIFIEPRNWRDDSKSEAVFEEARGVFYIGANFGPYTSESFYRDVRHRLEKAKDCCFRDTYSKNMFNDLDHVRYAPDVLFGYPDYPAMQAGAGLGISVISLDERADLKAYKDLYYNTIARICDICCEKQIPVTLFSFCTLEGDDRAINDILSRSVHREQVECCYYRGDIDTFLRKMNEREYWLATRFHAMILGWSMRKKVLPIIYSQKQTNVISDVGYTGPVWNMLSGEPYSATQLYEDCMGNQIFDVTELKIESKQQFAEFDRFIQMKG